ncbi:conserved hypothetical protein [Shewanella denitrificans OS217]|uniref:DUF2897 domain-containing protein n=1 Tax=Shewanella denitrificans (strain OS217 / ATCC BAA-1090 / DSM 15013) TaxID=318161 RepID=Q12MA9_SHEDO|nr:DUF2897 family protein [Shewanella denitrificans]ABE55417.1 conserved hypothetical protein [Shewanella denitrificans OS217]
MSSIEAWIIIILVLGVIASNIAVLKYSAKFKMPQFGKPEDKPTNQDRASESLDTDVSAQEKSTENSPESNILEIDGLDNAKSPTPAENTDNEDTKKSHLL